ncbi:DNA topoisomerase IB [Streptomyces sp. ISL-94]|uniref:DNA topoisomerase IB n=1 Tax=Streptomyces sp. ISL-94 TaxID=2819190 RepID=UPI001BECF739|nr:DNA topoisomerase IB [Streptomyces sp. ISL-94]MBT2478840.1 DNA topoisomerase IB [Streptomyces sp. ISL-94]
MRLRTSRPDRPGYTRVRHGRGFRYLDPAGQPVSDPAERARLRALMIPPAWTDVWICTWPGGHIQAMGTDAAGRRQYLYHQRFREQQEATKHEHVLDAARRLPRLREGIERDLAGRGLGRDRVLACAARLLDLGFFRVGGQAYRRDHEAYGLTTLLREHAACRRGGVCFRYPGKSGQEQTLALADPTTCEVVRALLRRRDGDSQLFVYWQGRSWRDVHADEVNDYLRSRSGADITAKDFRTWHATVLAAVALAVSVDVAGDSRARRMRAEARAVHEVSGYLGNTPAVCRASYINPRLFELFENGVTVKPALDRLGKGVEYGQPATHGEIEAAVLRLLSPPRPTRAPLR